MTNCKIVCSVTTLMLERGFPVCFNENFVHLIDNMMQVGFTV